MIFSLSYHYRNSVRNNAEKREHALKFTVKAADQAIARESYPDGLAFLQLAVPFADSIDEFRTLLEVVRTALNDLAPTRLTDLKNTLSRVRNSFVSQTSSQLDAAEMARQSIQSQYEKLQKELYKAIDKIESRGDNSNTADTDDPNSIGVQKVQPKASIRKSHVKKDLLGCLGGNIHDHGSTVPALVHELSYVKRQSRHRRSHMACVVL
jgi:chromosome segregation ATPase